jgi:hypothetical protein
MPNNLHTNAAALIVSAAKKFGLLEAVAEALCFIEKQPLPAGECCEGLCRACAIRDDLADEFDGSICTPAIVLEGFHGEGAGIGPFTKDEIAPFLGNTGVTRRESVAKKLAAAFAEFESDPFEYVTGYDD